MRCPIVCTPEAVLKRLRTVIDPELNISIVDLGLVRGIRVEEDTAQVAIDLTLTSPMCPLGPQILAGAKQAAERVKGVAATEIKLVWSPPWDPRIDGSDEAKAEMGIWD